jgi:hypothetical protein
MIYTNLSEKPTRFSTFNNSKKTKAPHNKALSVGCGNAAHPTAARYSLQPILHRNNESRVIDK